MDDGTDTAVGRRRDRPARYPSDRGTMFGHRILCAEPLLRLGEGEPAPLGEVTVEIAQGPAPAVGFRVGPRGEALPPAPARVDGGIVRLGAQGYATYDLDPVRSVVTVRGAHEDPVWRHRLLNGAVPVLLAARGLFMSHASGVVVDGRAILFVGPSRRGKSTAAAVAAELGWAVLAEDGVLVSLGEGARIDPATPAGVAPTAWPGALDVRLFDRLVTPEDTDIPPKLTHELSAERRHRSPAPVAAFVVLGPRGAGAELEELPTRFRVAGVMANSFSVDEATRAAQFPLAVELVSRVPVLRAHLPDDLDELPAALGRLVERVRANVSCT